jgi:hypothetical protein
MQEIFPEIFELTAAPVLLARLSEHLLDDHLFLQHLGTVPETGSRACAPHVFTCYRVCH